jgi:hypothetical protein
MKDFEKRAESSRCGNNDGISLMNIDPPLTLCFYGVRPIPLVTKSMRNCMVVLVGILLRFHPRKARKTLR